MYDIDNDKREPLTAESIRRDLFRYSKIDTAFFFFVATLCSLLGLAVAAMFDHHPIAYLLVFIDVWLPAIFIYWEAFTELAFRLRANGKVPRVVEDTVRDIGYDERNESFFWQRIHKTALSTRMFPRGRRGTTRDAMYFAQYGRTIVPDTLSRMVSVGEACYLVLDKHDNILYVYSTRTHRATPGLIEPRAKAEAE